MSLALGCFILFPGLWWLVVLELGNQSLFIDRRLDQYWNTGDPDIIDVFRKALETSTDDMLMNCDPRFRERALLVTKFKKLLSNQEKSPPSKKSNKRSTLSNVIQFASDNK